MPTVNDSAAQKPVRKAGRLRVGAYKTEPDQREAIFRVVEWTRARFSLDIDDTISAAEVSCTLPGCAPLETIVTFWTGDDKGGNPDSKQTRYAYKVFKPVAEVVEDDLPPYWMKPGLIDHGDGGCSCCG